MKNKTVLTKLYGLLSLSNLKMKVLLTLLVLLRYEQAILFLRSTTFVEDSSLLRSTKIECILDVFVGAQACYFYYWLVTLPSLFCNMRWTCYSHTWCASNSVYCAMSCFAPSGKGYSCIFNSLLYMMSRLRSKWYNEVLFFNISNSRISLKRSTRRPSAVLLFNISRTYNRYSHSALGSRTFFNRFGYSVGGLFDSTRSFTKLGGKRLLSFYFSSTLPISKKENWSIVVRGFHSSNYYQGYHYVTDYENIVVFPSVSDETRFKSSLENYLQSLDKDSWYVLLFYTYVSEVTPLKRRGDSLVSSGVFYCCICYNSSVDGIYESIKRSFFEKVNSLENECEDPFLTSEDSCYGYKWIDNNEVSFAKTFDLGDITDKSVSISGSDPEEDDDDDDCFGEGVSRFTISSNDYKLYNNSFNSKGLFSQEKRICINYNKALLLSANGIKVKRNFHTYTINRLLLPSEGGQRGTSKLALAGRFDLKVQFISRASSLSAYVGKRDLFHSTPTGSLSRRYFSTSFLFSNSTFSSSAVVPVKLYRKVDQEKLKILKENEGKAGVYRWTNISNGKSYVGSGVNLSKRIKDYYSLRYLETQIRKNKSQIYRSIIKHGYSKFSLEILEYCAPDKAIEREQYYLDFLNPEYNILKVAGSSLGFKHSPETIAKLRYLTPEKEAQRLEQLNRLHSSKEHKEHPVGPRTRVLGPTGLKRMNADTEFQAKRLEQLNRIHLSNKGRSRPEGSGRPSVSIEVFDNLTDQITVYSSIGEAAQAIGVNPSSISTAFNRKGAGCEAAAIFMKKKRYKLTKLPL